MSIHNKLKCIYLLNIDRYNTRTWLFQMRNQNKPIFKYLLVTPNLILLIKKYTNFPWGKKINSIAMQLRDMFYFIAFCKQNCSDTKWVQWYRCYCPLKQKKTSHVYECTLYLYSYSIIGLISRMPLASLKAMAQKCCKVLEYHSTGKCLK